MTLLAAPLAFTEDETSRPVSKWSQERSRRMVVLLSILWVLSAADLTFTLWAHWFTPFVEGNPLAAHLLAGKMYCSVVLLKLGTVTIGTWSFWRVRKYARAEIALALVVLGLFGLANMWSNYTRHAISERNWVDAVVCPRGSELAMAQNRVRTVGLGE